MKPDDVCERHSDRGVKLSISLLDEGMVLVEGDRSSLEFLAELIKAQARYESDCGFSIQPGGAGSLFFGKDSKLGIYIHRTNCESASRQVTEEGSVRGEVRVVTRLVQAYSAVPALSAYRCGSQVYGFPLWFSGSALQLAGIAPWFSHCAP